MLLQWRSAFTLTEELDETWISGMSEPVIKQKEKLCQWMSVCAPSLVSLSKPPATHIA